jgi:phosphocarrier protein FPr
MPPRIPTHTVSDVGAEWEALLTALKKTRAQIRADRENASRRTDAYTASLFDAHLLFLEDEELRAPAHQAIFEEGLNAAAAWQGAVERITSAYRRLDDHYLQARSVDVEDVGRLVLVNLLGGEVAPLAFNEPGILVAPDLTLAETARIDPARVLGVCLALGSPTSHSAILLRGLGVPAVAGLGESALNLADGASLIVDGEEGAVYPAPEPALLADFTRRAEAKQANRASALAASTAPALTADGRRVEIVANIGSVSEARVAIASGAEGIGVFRTEYLFLDRQVAPDEEEQYAAYRAVAEVLGGRPLIIRTLDAGGDKPIPYLDMGHEANPFLGWRAIRLCLARPAFFKVQLRAILRLAAEFPVKVMFPMIATLSEWRSASVLLNEAQAEVRARGLSTPDRMETGIMVEIPSAALCAPHFAPEVDFFSIGTNDLTQYTLAVERGNPRVAALSDAFHPAVLSLIRQVVEAAHAQGKWVGVCGEMAGDPLAIPLLVGLGIDELSMSAPGIPRAKQIIQALNYTVIQPQVAGLFDLETPEAIRAALASLQLQKGVGE